MSSINHFKQTHVICRTAGIWPHKTKYSAYHHTVQYTAIHQDIINGMETAPNQARTDITLIAYITQQM